MARGGAAPRPPVRADVDAREGSGRRAATSTLTVPADAHGSPSRTGIATGEAGRYTFDDDAPFGLPYRPTPFYVQVTLSFGPRDGGGLQRPAGAVPLRGRHLQRREAIRAAGRARACRCASRRRSRSCRSRPPAPPPRAAAAAGRGRGTPAPARRACRRAWARRSASSAAPPAADPADTREVRVTVVNDTKGAAESVVTLDVPEGWTSTPAEQRGRRSRARTNRRRCASRCEPRRAPRPASISIARGRVAGRADVRRAAIR